MLRIDAVVEPGDADRVGLTVLGDGTTGTRIGYDTDTGRLFVDRREGGAVSFHPAFASVDDAPVALEDGRLVLRVWVDRSSVEVFAQGGLRTITDQVFPTQGADRVSLWSEGGTAHVESVVVTPMEASMFDVPADGAERAAGCGPARGRPDPEVGRPRRAFTVQVIGERGAVPAGLVRLYEDGVLVDKVVPSVVKGVQHVRFALSDVAPGRHVYTAELANSQGVTRAGPLTVVVAPR